MNLHNLGCALYMSFCHTGFEKDPNAFHMCANIKFHPYDRRYKCILEIIS
jgi:hypothetical protein